MSVIPKETIEVIAQTIGITNLSSDVALALAPDLEYRIREIMQESIKCMRHGKRTFLTADDVDAALALRNLEPAIPENAPFEASSEIRTIEYKDDALPVDVKLPVKHIITTELQLYYEKIIELILNKPGSIPFRRALVTLATDSGLHPLVPYFSRFVADELHQLMPPIITCIVAKRIGNRLSDNHWELRDFSANLVALICKRFGHMYHNLQPRVTKTFLHSFLDPTKALPQHYGAIKGITALGSRLVRLLILPNLEPYMHLLEPEMQLEKQKNEIKRQEAWRVYGALLCAVGQNMHEKVKRCSSLVSPPTRATSSGNGKAMNAMPGVTGNVVPMNSMSVDNMQGSTSGFSPMMGVSNSNMGMSSSMGRQLSKENNSSSSILAQAWKDDIDAGQLLPPVFELFGESLLSFIPKPEAFVFL
ncbi:hypothetical protein TSUD_153380 [Trifolium subterraneum]|uniref:TATA box binding protein associated factor (TAF) histone-like fold domain-containing protein n=1 Tax=Trifolium subterraneum TaxID=3900 RepID=A0A2Z6MNI3_TRISU|nr:hypothetical protein TSUD_153380 [Trifolium subterraneum]